MVLRVLFGGSIFLAEVAHTEHGLEKTHMIYPSNGILSNKKKRGPHTRYNMDKP